MDKTLVQRLIALADSFDEQGKAEEAAALDKILAEANNSFERERSIAKVLLQVASSLDAKGAVKEAQMADQLVTELADADLSLEQVPDAGVATQTEIKSVPKLEAEYDEISLDDLRKVRDSSA